jgi:dihydrofolate reductase
VATRFVKGTATVGCGIPGRALKAFCQSLSFGAPTGLPVMAKFWYSAAMSADGFIAGAGGDMSWLVDYLGPNPVVDELVGQIGALLVGRRTFGGDDPYRDTPAEGEAFGGAWHGPQVVLTHNPPVGSGPDVTFAQDLSNAVDLAAHKAGDNYVNVLGANVAAQCVQRGVLDEILLTIVPVFLGDGVRLFDQPGGNHVPLELVSVTHTDIVTNAWFRVIRR